MDKKVSKKEKGDQAFLKMINEKPPEGYSYDASKPDVTFEVDHVYGFAGDRYKNGLHFGKTNDEIIFSAAALGICQDLKTRKQKFFGGQEKPKDADKYLPNNPFHQDDITTLDIAGGELRNIVATGECGKLSTVHVWDTLTMSSIAQFSLGPSAKGVAALSISPCQRYVACVDQSNDHNMYIYNVQRKKMLLTLSAGTDSIFNIQWSKKPNDLKFVAVTTRSIQFWNPADASKKLYKNGTFGQKYTQTKFNCATFDEDGICYSGGANGGIHVWDQKQDLGLVLKAHAGDVTGVACAQGVLVSTGKDDMVSVFSCDQGEYQFLRQIALEQYHFASAIDVLDGKIVVGHDNGKIQTVNVDGSNREIVNASHFDGEAWGLQVVEDQGTFLTCGDDNLIYEYSIKDKKLLREGKVWTYDMYGGKAYETSKIKSTASTLSSTPVHMQARGITYDSKWKHVAVSNNYGDVAILDYNDLTKRITTLYKPREWCEVMVYSPNHEYLAVGSHDDSIYIYKIDEKGYSLHWAITFVHSSAITAMDWSKDSKYLRAIDQAYAK